MIVHRIQNKQDEWKILAESYYLHMPVCFHSALTMVGWFGDQEWLLFSPLLCNRQDTEQHEPDQLRNKLKYNHQKKKLKNQFMCTCSFPDKPPT